MITDRFGHEYPDILSALRANLQYDAAYAHHDSDAMNRIDLRNLRATLYAIVASASAEKAAAERIKGGESADAVIAAACGTRRDAA